MGWDEMFFVGFVWLLLILVAIRRRHTPTAPLKRGGWNAVFLFDNEEFSVYVSPLERG